ncbi:MAG: MurR/RpiR family transcriptional regulator [Lactobacillus crispatus]|nr:MurR/RpiR family transcriptional regulator [Lactobacillus crispatus]MCI1335713.1 MurR/RpiR family transcriptional regulator [Lactobacillus crispatus]MCI1364866.1 MurR/RpiR family transcriptional regulator [Lactobacillus crispatus]MCI1493712.1 MurR/RpiR family transcriptional regulator [Lactobacillus crispatus]MCI1523711.1 MurR/RpiR family transcriptional regulator [Lactobacillus crispatus]
MDLETAVMKKKESFNETDKAIVSYLLKHPEAASQLSLLELAQKLYVSKSAIFRLSKKLGLSGFSELKFELSELATRKKQNVKNKQTLDFDTDLQKIIAETFKYFKGLNLQPFFADLDQAETIYLYSTGWQQQIIAEYLAHNFFLIGKKAIILPSARDEVALLGRSARENDMLFVISFGGFNKTIIEELKKIDVVNTELKLVSLTSWQTGKLASLSDYSFFFKTTPFQFSKQNAVTFSSAYVLIDLIMNSYGRHCDLR